MASLQAGVKQKKVSPVEDAAQQNRSERQSREKGAPESYDGIRLHGIPETISGKGRERFELEVKAVESLLTYLQTQDFKNDDIRRVGTYNNENKNPHKTILKLANQRHSPLMLQSVHKLASYEHRLYLGRELTSKERNMETKHSSNEEI